MWWNETWEMEQPGKICLYLVMLVYHYHYVGGYEFQSQCRRYDIYNVDSPDISGF